MCHDDEGQAGLKVRRGLGTAEAGEADALVAQMNALLADESYWYVTERTRAEQHFADVVVRAFYEPMESPSGEDPAAIREKEMPLPGRAEGYSRVMLIGTTGAGKTSLLRQLIGSHPIRDRFPSTSTGKTTIADTEVISAPGQFEAVVTFFPRRLVRTYVAESVSEACKTAWLKGTDERVMRELLNHRDQRFRLGYLIGAWSPADAEPEEDGWGDDNEEDLEDGGEAGSLPGADERASMQSTLEGYLDVTRELATQAGAEVSEALGADLEEFVGNDQEAAVDLLVDQVEQLPRYSELVDAISAEVLQRFDHLDEGTLTRRGGWPEKWTFSSADRDEFMRREPHSPYTGMLPGYVAGAYDWDDIHIDLAKLARFADARFIAAEAVGIDAAERCLVFANRPPLRYDVLAVNTGGVPGERFASEFVTPVKPIGRFIPVWTELTASGTPPRRLGIVGAGAGGVELALAINHRYPGTRCTIVDGDDEILRGFSGKARRHLESALRKRGISLVTGARVSEARAGELVAGDTAIAVDHALWTTGVEAPGWFADAGIHTDPRGFVSVNEYLQSTSHPEIFAAGDVAHGEVQPRPKAGVYAVRQGPILAENLRRFATGRRLRRFRAQRHAMAIVGLGRGNAVASRGGLYASGAWVWAVKQWIDRRFMHKFNNLPVMSKAKPEVSTALQEELPTSMRCGGCGAKLGAEVLNAVLRRLDVPVSPTTLSGIGDDAAVVQVAAGNLAVSCDGFRAMIDDTYRFGRIGAQHALNDLFAMGAEPRFALALATVPVMADPLMEEDLYQMMAGALDVFTAHGVDLVGGHSAEGGELGLAFSVTGMQVREPMTKGGLSPGEALVLTRAIGTGALLAGAMVGRTRAEDLLVAIDHMDSSNADAADVLRRYGARGCTDVTGFGLAGHLWELTRASETGARIRANDVPTLPGALELIASGVESSLQANNRRAMDDYEITGSPDAPALRLLADPQTSGGLLAGVPNDAVAECIEALRDHGHASAAVIGEVTAGTRQIVV